MLRQGTYGTLVEPLGAFFDREAIQRAMHASMHPLEKVVAEKEVHMLAVAESQDVRALFCLHEAMCCR